jgi:putative protease
VVYTRVPMMITKHCPVKAHFQLDDGPCRGAYCLKKAYGLRDRKEKVMPMIRSGKCLMEIFNSQHLIWIDHIQELKAMGIRKFRLEFTDENEKEIEAAIQAFRLAIEDGRIDQKWINYYRNQDSFTKGHYKRGV